MSEPSPKLHRVRHGSVLYVVEVVEDAGPMVGVRYVGIDGQHATPRWYPRSDLLPHTPIVPRTR